MRRLEEWRDGEWDTTAPTTEATERFMDEVRAAMPDTIWASGGCDSWYLAADGMPSVWPWTGTRHREILLNQFEPRDWHYDAVPLMTDSPR